MLRAVAALALVAACGGDDHPNDSIDPLHYGELLANARCKFYARCGEWASEQACETYIYSKSIPDPSLPAAIAAGATKFDSAQAQACLDAVAATPCDQTTMAARAPVPACLAAITGLGAMGATCAQNSECASNACNVPSCTMACCTGTCVAARVPAQVNESCVGRECADGLACTSDTSICIARVGAGGACKNDDYCNYGLGCDFTTMMCTTLPLLGQPCPDGSCAEVGARCLSGTCTALGTTGAACAAVPECERGWNCPTNTCQPLPTLGQPCGFDCSDGSWCNMDLPTGMRTCIAPAPNGTPCTGSPFKCASFYCDMTAGMCADPTACI